MGKLKFKKLLILKFYFEVNHPPGFDNLSNALLHSIQHSSRKEVWKKLTMMKCSHFHRKERHKDYKFTWKLLARTHIYIFLNESDVLMDLALLSGYKRIKTWAALLKISIRSRIFHQQTKTERNLSCEWCAHWWWKKFKVDWELFFFFTSLF